MLNFDVAKIIANDVGNHQERDIIYSYSFARTLCICAPVHRQTACMKPLKRFVAGVDYARTEDSTLFLQVS